MQPSDIRRALVIGAGTMGPGIAQVYAIAGHEVDLTDSHPAALDRARDQVRTSLETLAAVGAIRPEDAPTIAARIRFTTDLDAVAPLADVVTEAITEDREAKRELFRRLDPLLKPDTLIASNTSGLNVFQLLQDVLSPNHLPNLVIHHYFLPATIIPLVEVVGGPHTSPATIERSLRLLESLGRVPVVLRKFHPNFIVNSFQIALGRVVAELLSEGVATPDEIDRAVKHSLGIRLPIVGVAQSLDFTGLDLISRILRNSGLDASHFEAHVARGHLGARSGKGLYDYGERTPTEIEAKRDRKYWQHRQDLTDLGAFEPI